MYTWGTYGINGDQPLQWKPLNELTTSHLLNILITETWHLPLHYICEISNILKSRGVKITDQMLEKEN